MRSWGFSPCAFLALAAVLPCGAFYFHLPESYYMHTYYPDEAIFVKVNSLTSFLTGIPFDYYSLPYCRPADGVKKSVENLGELLIGDRIHNSPYRFRMLKNESLYLCTTDPLTEEQAKLLNTRSQDMYQVNVILDNLPAMRYIEQQNGAVIQWTGFPVGFSTNGTDYMINHLMFKVLVHEHESGGVEYKKRNGYEIVGFEVLPCSVKRDADKFSKYKMYDKVEPSVCWLGPDYSQPSNEKERVAFTYEVTFEKSDIKWPSRWDAYLKMKDADYIHQPSIIISLMVIFLLACVVFVIFLRTVRREHLTGYEELDQEAQAQMNEELSGWKLVVGDVFREPAYPRLLCVMVADGVQIVGVAVVTTVFAALGFMSLASRGTILTGMIILYFLLGIVAGYSGIRLWRTIKGTSEGWRSVSCSISCFFPAIAFLIRTISDLMLWADGATAANPVSLYSILLLLWFSISLPLTLLGGFLGTRAEPIQYPVRTNRIPREIPQRKCPSWFLVAGAGTLPFGTLFIQLFFILSSIWLGRFYCGFGILPLILLLLVILCAQVSVVVTYVHLCVENWRWWWKAFIASGSVGLYVFLYSINYFVFDLKNLSGPVSLMLSLGYSLLMAIAIMLSTGAVGFLVSFYFVHYIFSSMKID